MKALKPFLVSLQKIATKTKNIVEPPKTEEPKKEEKIDDTTIAELIKKRKEQRSKNG